MKVAVLGAGAWGTALAVHASTLQPTLLWARDAGQAAQMSATRQNARYLAGVALPANLQVSADFDAALEHAADGLLAIATPMATLGEMLKRVGPAAHVVWLCKGFEQQSGWLGHEVAAATAPSMPVGVVSGPSFAIEVARGQPTALVVASADSALRERAIDALHGGSVRVYTSNDPIGVEVGGAVKNVLAIATGIADGMALGLNARAALVTRGLAEMTRLGVALGADAQTFMGLSGLGDLVLTTTGNLSRNRQVGLALAGGSPLRDILADLGHVAEGVYSAPMLLRRAQALGVDMPISEAVVRVLEGSASPQRALAQLMGRGARSEA